jgi:hypothetical protein
MTWCNRSMGSRGLWHAESAWPRRCSTCLHHADSTPAEPSGCVALLRRSGSDRQRSLQVFPHAPRHDAVVRPRLLRQHRDVLQEVAVGIPKEDRRRRHPRENDWLVRESAVEIERAHAGRPQRTRGRQHIVETGAQCAVRRDALRRRPASQRPSIALPASPIQKMPRRVPGPCAPAGGRPCRGRRRSIAGDRQRSSELRRDSGRQSSASQPDVNDAAPFPTRGHVGIDSPPAVSIPSNPPVAAVQNDNHDRPSAERREFVCGDRQIAKGGPTPRADIARPSRRRRLPRRRR